MKQTIKIQNGLCKTMVTSVINSAMSPPSLHSLTVKAYFVNNTNQSPPPGSNPVYASGLVEIEKKWFESCAQPFGITLFLCMQIVLQ